MFNMLSLPSVFITGSLVLFMKADITVPEGPALVEPWANMAWTQSVMHDCQIGKHGTHKGRVRLLVQMMEVQAQILASHCTCMPSKSEQVELWQNLTLRLLPSLAILDQTINKLDDRFQEIQELLLMNSYTLYQAKVNHHRINKLHRRISWVCHTKYAFKTQ